MHEDESEAFGDAGYQGAAKRPDAKPLVRWNIAKRPTKRRALDRSRESTPMIDELQKLKSSIRAKV